MQDAERLAKKADKTSLVNALIEAGAVADPRKGKDFFKRAIEDRGGKIGESVSADTFLVMQHGKSDGSPSAKEQAAAKKGAKVISVAELEKML